MFNRLMAGIVTLAAAIVLAGCDDKPHNMAATAPPPPPAREAPAVKTYDYTQKTVTNARKNARRWTVAILRFGDTKEVEGVPFGAASEPAANGEVNVNVRVNTVEGAGVVRETPPQINKRARELLKHTLVKSEAFNVVERERILEILREINFGKTKYVDPAGAAEEGQIIAVRYLIEGSLGLNEDKTLKDNIEKEPTYKDGISARPGLWDNVFNPGKINREKMLSAMRKVEDERAKNRARREFNIACYLSVYDVRTGAVRTTVMGLGTNGLEAIEDAVEELIDELSTAESEVLVAAVSGEKIFLDIGANGNIKAGARFQVVHQGNAIRSRDGDIIGYEESEVGEIEVTDIQPMLSVARIVTKAGDIARGDLAKPAKH